MKRLVKGAPLIKSHIRKQLIIIIMILLASHVVWAADHSPLVGDEVKIALIPLPQTQLFMPLRAAPKELRFFVRDVE